jgi:hypothetical protein
MDVNNLIRMANRIAEFFEAMPEHDEALDGVAQHIQKFWEPRMRLHSGGLERAFRRAAAASGARRAAQACGNAGACADTLH